MEIEKSFEAPSKLNRDKQNVNPIDLGALEFTRRNEIPRAPRKEVIQPQVLLQLPCYDFTPITDHTLSGYPPCGLAHRFLVQPTFVM